MFVGIPEVSSRLGAWSLHEAYAKLSSPVSSKTHDHQTLRSSMSDLNLEWYIQ